MSKCRSFPLPGLKKSAMQSARALMGLAFVLFALVPAFSQTAFTLPPWLVSYPGTNPKVYSSDSFAQTSYVVDAEPADVVEHYRKLFEAQGLAFQPNPDGMGMTIRVAAKECDLFIQIRRREERTVTKVTCSGKVDPSSIQAPENPNIEMITGITPPPPKAKPGELTGSDQQGQTLAPIKVNKAPHPMPAPPLVWPGWLGQVRGQALKPMVSADSTRNRYLKAKYTTDAPATEIFDFYRNLLMDHDYRPRGGLATGGGAQPMGIEGVNYVDGAPGANSTIEISIDRTVRDGSVTVALRFSTHDYSPGGNKGNGSGNNPGVHGAR
ncbi:MAG: hypothetical protein ABSF28_21765 [Terracidiphilus sp.]